MTATAKRTKSTPPEQEPVTSVVTVELVNIEGMLPAAVFTLDNIEEFIKRIKKEKEAFKGDATTPTGRKAIVSFANRFTKTKTAVDEMGKSYVAILKDEPKRIDALRKLFRDTMDAWHEEIRRPVTALEEADKKRKEEHEKMLETIGAQITFPIGQPSSAEVQRRIDFVNVYQQRGWEEYDELYQTTYKAVMDVLVVVLAGAKKAEGDAKELAALKAKQAEDAVKAREEAARIAGIEEGQRLAAAAVTAPQPSILTQNEPAKPDFYRGHTEALPTPAPVKDEAKAKINREVLADLMAYGCKEEGAKALIKAIVTGTIRHITINYGA